jgi:charged multivesicular body protein 6
MKTQRDKLHQYQKKITVVTDRETEIARECLRRGDKRKALLALRRKKYQESLLQKTDAQLAQLEILTNDVEFALIQKDVMYGLQQGTAVLKEIHKEMGGVEGVEKLLGESEEAREYQKEINEMLAGQISTQDEADVELELEALESEVNGVQLSGRVTRPSLPAAPSQELLPKAPAQEPQQTRRIRERDGERMLA